MATTVTQNSEAVRPSVTPERIMQMAWGYTIPLILEAALHHQVFYLLDGGPKNLRAIARETGASERGLAAILNVLVGLEFLKKDGDAYELTPESAAFLVSTKPSFMGGILRHTSQDLIPKWLYLNDVVATGGPTAAVNQQKTGAEFFEKFVNDIFPMSYGAAQDLANHLQLERKDGQAKVLDLAAGSGVWGIALAQSAPNVTVCAVDWPGVLPVTRKNV